MNTTVDTEMKKDSKIQDFTKNMKEYSSEAVESITEGYDTALSWVKKNPLQAAAIGAGVGFVIGAAIRKFGKEKQS
jgi:ElaB/YqjD/DUF883 family membrane-anchored ribosome-binding protein